MKAFIVPSDKDGKKVIRVALAQYDTLTLPTLQRALKHKDIRVNGKRISQDIAVAEGDRVELWLPEEVFAPPSVSPYQGSDFKVVFESDQLLLVNKRQGLAVHSGRGTSGPTLIDIVRQEQRNPNIDLCHRIDMNTGGLVLLAKNKNSLEHANQLFKQNLVTKRYRCLVRGVPTVGEAALCSDDTIMKEVRAFLEKPAKGNVFIHDAEKPGDLPIITRYRVLQVISGGPDKEDISELEVELVTGRTHQIRAHMAHLGHPILGDGNYGRNAYNQWFKTKNGSKVRYQQLFATTLLFSAIPKDNLHHALAHRKFSIIPRYDIELDFKAVEE